MRLLLAIVAVAALAALAVLAGRLFPSEKTKVIERAEALIDAVEAEDVAGVEASLSPAFRFEGFGTIGRGGRSEAVSRMRRLSEEPEAAQFHSFSGNVLVEIEGDCATWECDGWGGYGGETREDRHRRQWSGTGLPVSVRLRFVRSQGGPWLAESAEIEERTTGRRERR